MLLHAGYHRLATRHETQKVEKEEMREKELY